MNLILNRETPVCMKGIKQLPRKEISAYKPDDMWTNKEHAIFLKYCHLFYFIFQSYNSSIKTRSDGAVRNANAFKPLKVVDVNSIDPSCFSLDGFLNSSNYS